MKPNNKTNTHEPNVRIINSFEVSVHSFPSQLLTSLSDVTTILNYFGVFHQSLAFLYTIIDVYVPLENILIYTILTMNI